MPLNTVLHERRRELGLTQEQIAEYLGVSTPAVNKWEKEAQSSLYHYLYPESKANISISAKVLPPLLTMLENTSEYDYLRSHKKFQELIEKYRKKVEHEY